jgi:hypothetical protein
VGRHYIEATRFFIVNMYLLLILNPLAHQTATRAEVASRACSQSIYQVSHHGTLTRYAAAHHLRM